MATLNRSLLESLDWVAADLANVGLLLAASPKLALALLADRAFALEVALFFQDTNAPLGASAWRRVKEIDAALAAAGVEVP